MEMRKTNKYSPSNSLFLHTYATYSDFKKFCDYSTNVDMGETDGCPPKICAVGLLDEAAR